MKKRFLIGIMMCCLASLLQAAEGSDQQKRLSPEEFRAKQQAYIVEKAGLTAEEATAFFPIYFELQERKREMNRKAWRLLKKGNDEQTTDDDYEQIMEDIYDVRIASAELEKTYYKKFKKILSAKKIFRVQHAEMRFQRDMLKGMRGPKDKRKK